MPEEDLLTFTPDHLFRLIAENIVHLTTEDRGKALVLARAYAWAYFGAQKPLPDNITDRLDALEAAWLNDPTHL